MYCAIIYYMYKELHTPSAQKENSTMKRKTSIIPNHQVSETDEMYV